MSKTAAFWIRDGVLIDRMPVNAVAFAVASLAYAQPEARLQVSLSSLINFALQVSGISCAEKMRKFSAEQLPLVADIDEAASYYNTLATEAAKRCDYIPGARDLLKELHSHGVLNFITSAVEQDVLDAWAESEQGRQIMPVMTEILGKRSRDFYKGEPHFSYVREKYGIDRIIYIADAVSEISTAHKCAEEFKIEPIGFANEISLAAIKNAYKLVLEAHAGLHIADAVISTEALILNESILSLPGADLIAKSLLMAGAGSVIRDLRNGYPS